MTGQKEKDAALFQKIFIKLNDMYDLRRGESSANGVHRKSSNAPNMYILQIH